MKTVTRAYLDANATHPLLPEARQAMIDALAKGDEVVTSGGMIGKITKIGESFLSVEIATGVEIQVQRGAVVQVLPKGTVK